MHLAFRARSWFTAFVASAFIAIAWPAAAQEISDSHIKAAREALDALTATRRYDDILPQAGQALKQEMTQKNPDMVELIIQLVNEKTLELASRRGDLEREAATIYAKIFTEQQLNEMTEFYRSETGKKLLEDGGLVARQVHEAAEIWQRGVARDLAQSVTARLEEAIAANVDDAAVTTEEGTVEEDTAEQVNQ